jgi:XTP/dITP diphosphohydrolase
MNIVLASRNKKKIEELRKIIEDSVILGADESVNILTPDEFPQCGDVEENGATFEENAIKKAEYIATCSGITAVADDSGLEVDALNGAPGVFSARYAGEYTDDRANLEKLLYEMKDIPQGKRIGRFICCIAIASQRCTKTFFGYVEGRIGLEPKGDKGFGYDPVFYPMGFDRTFAEMSEEEKNDISHRGRALMELLKYLRDSRFRL